MAKKRINYRFERAERERVRAERDAKREERRQERRGPGEPEPGDADTTGSAPAKPEDGAGAV